LVILYLAESRIFAMVLNLTVKNKFEIFKTIQQLIFEIEKTVELKPYNS